ncbi:hypothetical protein GCM10022199_16910 [Marihabitans asiaticum]|uniref:DUF1648 domain-containing protein n=1 Tax=Marihabitans asiaticum TaxID=415218 RepID=A0A560W7N3_9MICO|nr:DUF1648 domain-containing protein [Marihabitans asiaticum]TWD13627.1 hypothetical protein FB557_2254 [Marihabitans asiaticum]
MTEQRKAWWAVLLWPLVITAAGVLAYLSFMDQLPEQVATHWSSRQPDGFTAREDVPWLGLIGLVTAWFTGGVVLAVGGRDGTARRLAVGLTAGLAIFTSGVLLLGTYGQRGLDHGRGADGPEWPLVLSLLGALLVGGLAALTVRGRVAGDARAAHPVPAAAPRAELAPDEKPEWSRTARPGRSFGVLFAVVLVLIAGTGLLTSAWLFTLLLLVLVGGLLLALSAFRVQVDATGLHITSVLGLPRWHLPPEDVAEARVVQVDPLTDFGGWGYRLGLHGRTGFVVRKGAALEVERGDGTAWVVTVDDPEQGAGLLNSLADRARH